MDAVTHRTEIARLAEQFMAEFAGTMPPGQILRVVHQADRLVLRSAGGAENSVSLCEAIARGLIRVRVAEATRRGRAVTPRPERRHRAGSTSKVE
ncbi:hypothetical protein LRP67_04285 [Nocardioides sp. cx-169]|uniref:hypothetical protein n=1 Tax=Nocardioides sp. cx-169 TaxID=2899080 RepID=UPI001E3DD2D4|nr:hypothetical protein [Nocardioides sp. cx-169]MCD4533299.1 hypothetical protein [Nocardioides sp. cx-169]